MADNKQEWELTGLERFGHLEDKIFRTVEAFKAIKKENDTLRAENLKMKGEIELLLKNESSAKDGMIHLQKEREALRERVEKALTLLASLETK